MFNEKDFDSILNATVYDRTGDKIGSVGQLYLDDETGQPSWVTVNTGLFGMSESFIPVDDTTKLDGDRIEVPYEKDLVKDAPRIDADGHLDPGQEQELYSYYKRDYTADRGVADTHRDHDRDLATDRDVVTDRDRDVVADRDRTADRRDGVTDKETLTAQEERLNVGKEQHEAGRARLRKYTTTEQETVTVPVEKEVLRVDREPVEGETRSDGNLRDHEDVDEEIVLREERPVVDKEVHDVERVSVGKETVTEQHHVTEDVAKEHIEVEGETTDRRDPR